MLLVHALNPTAIWDEVWHGLSGPLLQTQSKDLVKTHEQTLVICYSESATCNVCCAIFEVLTPFLYFVTGILKDINSVDNIHCC